MASDLETLHELQTLDLGLYEKKREIEAYESALIARRSKIEAVEAEVERLSSQRKHLISERALAERAVADSEGLLRERRQRAGRVRNERELHMNEREVKEMGDELSKGEESLLALMEQVDEIEAKIVAARKEAAELKAADHLHVNEAETRIGALKSELDAARDGRQSLADTLEGRIRRHYDTVLQKRGGLAVANADSGSCSGCYMQVPPQTLNEIMKTGAIRVCQSCNRILYVRPPAE